jgi:hypothetical protein
LRKYECFFRGKEMAISGGGEEGGERLTEGEGGEGELREGEEPPPPAITLADLLG